ncbi:MAG: 4-hydroxy-3-methylbut-2-enyl diphosphate reductase [Bacteroidales bacterium]|jgi:4-hydroxy-3-methylbut-2-enyl diphosphate reductase|nr:4-hydroxy-3-methylbut-2-enyl diphosphate reductase [Bacteroidales bacterium]
MVKIEIDKSSGFCFGVVNAIKQAEAELKADEILYCLGDIVHNSHEVKRLNSMGLQTINHEELSKLHDVKVLLRAHGEPPSTYEIARKNNIRIIDATCPVVLQLQRKIKKTFDNLEQKDTQIVIYGKNGHAEVNGLVGQTENKAIVVENVSDLDKIDFSRPIKLFSQTTKSLDGFSEIVEKIKSRAHEAVKFEYFDTVCRQVSSRIDKIRDFASEYDLIFFVSGEKSSNGKILYEECHQANPNSIRVSGPNDIEKSMLKNAQYIGICGATSTPKWLMEEIAEKIKLLLNGENEK